MSIVWSITLRNLRLFFRDRASVFFSLLSMIIVMGLYILFLGDIMISQISQELGQDVRWMMDSWIMGGLLAVTAVTTTLGAMGTMVDDRRMNIRRDFIASPIGRMQLTGGYILSTYSIGLIISLLAICFAEIYIVVYGGRVLDAALWLPLLGTTLLSVFSGTAMVLFMVSFFKSANAFGTASTVVGTMIGFLTGIYVPIGSLPEAVQAIVKFFPPSHSGALFRQIFMETPMRETFAGMPAQAAAEAQAAIESQLGVRYAFGSFEMTPWVSVLILLGSGVLFFLLSVWRMSRKEN